MVTCLFESPGCSSIGCVVCSRSVRLRHATDAMVADGRVRREDKKGNDAVHIGAGFGRFRQLESVIDARRNLIMAKRNGIREC